MKVKTEHQKCHNLITELVQLIQDNGGYINPTLKLEVRCSDLTFSYEKKPKPGERLFSLPINCMPVLSDFSYQISSDDFLIATPKDARATSLVHKRMMEISTAIYNLYNKVEEYVKTAPPIALRASHELCGALLKAVNLEVMSLDFLPSLDDLKIVSYWHTRAYHDVQTATDRLIPLLEFTDHHSLAEGFHGGISDNDVRCVETYYQPVDTGMGREVYISYSLMDALESFVKYGFVDSSAFFVKSQPFEMELPAIGSVKVSNQDVKSHQIHPDQWLWPPKYKKNAQFYASSCSYREGQIPCINFCLIPPRRHVKAIDEALRHQFALLEKSSKLGAGVLNNRGVITSFKRAVIRENKKFYKRLHHLAKAAQLEPNDPVSIMLDQMIRHQMQIICGYEKAAL